MVHVEFPSFGNIALTALHLGHHTCYLGTFGTRFSVVQSSIWSDTRSRSTAGRADSLQCSTSVSMVLHLGPLQSFHSISPKVPCSTSDRSILLY